MMVLAINEQEEVLKVFVEVYRMGAKFWVKGFGVQLTKKISVSTSLD